VTATAQSFVGGLWVALLAHNDENVKSPKRLHKYFVCSLGRFLIAVPPGFRRVCSLCSL